MAHDHETHQEPTREVVSAQQGLNRAERRHGASMKRRLETMGRTNTPYRKDPK